MGEGVERTARRMRGLDSILPAAWKNLNRSVIKETLRGQRSTCIAIRRLRSFTLLYLYRRTRSPRRPFSFSSTKTFAVRATFLRRTPLTARFCPSGAFEAPAHRSHSPRQAPLHGVTNHAKSQDVVKNTNIIKTSRKNVHFRKNLQKNLKKLQKRC